MPQSFLTWWRSVWQIPQYKICMVTSVSPFSLHIISSWKTRLLLRNKFLFTFTKKKLKLHDIYSQKVPSFEGVWGNLARRIMSCPTRYGLCVIWCGLSHNSEWQKQRVLLVKEQSLFPETWLGTLEIDKQRKLDWYTDSREHSHYIEQN